MTPERMKELLNQIVDWVAIAENTSEQIKMLIQMGFTTNELIHEFHYSANDIQEWLNHQDNTEQRTNFVLYSFLSPKKRDIIYEYTKEGYKNDTCNKHSKHETRNT